jgi:integrase
MERKQLTDDVIAALAPKRKRRLVYDSEVRSLAVSISPKGKRTFVVVKRLNGNKHASRRKLGAVGRITIDHARQLALKADMRSTGKFGDVAERYFDEIKAQRSRGEPERMIRRELFPRWENKQIASITREDMTNAIKAVKDRGAPSAAHHLFAYAQGLFGYAIAHNLIEHSPCAGIKPTKLIGAKTRRKRVLTDDEIKAVWRACDKLATPYARLVQLLLVTMQRLSDIADAKLEELDTRSRTLSIPPERFKSDVPHIVPLSQLALDIIAKLPQLRGGLFRITGWTQKKRKLDKYVRAELRRINPSATLTNYTHHDLRRTGRTRLSEKALAVPYEVREAVIGHAKKDLDRVYDQYDFLEEKREALDAWAARLSGIVSDTKGKSA